MGNFMSAEPVEPSVPKPFTSLDQLDLDSKSPPLKKYTSETLDKYGVSPDAILWFDVIRDSEVSLEFLIRYQSYIRESCGFKPLSDNPNLTDEIIREFICDNLDLMKICKNRTISPEYVHELLCNKSFSSYIKRIILEFYPVDFATIDAMIKIEGPLYFLDDMTRYQSLSEPFMHKYASKLNWNIASQYQMLSLEFIKEHEQFIKWNKLACNKCLTADIVSEYLNKLSKTELVLVLAK